MSPRALVRPGLWGLVTLVVGEAVLERDLHLLGGDSLAWVARVVAATVIALVAIGIAMPAAEHDSARSVAAELIVGVVAGAALVLPLAHGHRSDVVRGTWIAVGVSLGAVLGIVRRGARSRRRAVIVGMLVIAVVVAGRVPSGALAASVGAWLLGRTDAVAVVGLGILALALRIGVGRLDVRPSGPRRGADRPHGVVEAGLLRAPIATSTWLGLGRGRAAAGVALLLAGTATVAGLAALVRGDPAGAVPVVVGVLALGLVVGRPLGGFLDSRGLVALLPVRRSRVVRVSAAADLLVLAVAVLAGGLLAPVPLGLASSVVVVGLVGIAAATTGVACVIAVLHDRDVWTRNPVIPIVAMLAGALFVTAPAVQANLGLAQHALILEDVAAAASFGVVVGLAGVSFASWWGRDSRA
ncbi:hypothetical protein Afer_1544 [Acidimicrobium ferrooxidans DSM 10331]|uniref:Uncharacterized protein n=1 Tax=Acidimicrobium ferrooxidans (strain DSM 10331 / JCM 15462 / NBRC 103882 / ICP) TaxID=525909 RepID=C7M0F8_ACIFD|nr:hypothetical protein [Acidimicrobium ferrooxidans]ACU54466.1 hypothetical protein Afer_1544 [Acidimicrobium ferrooxidans DSM 10331]